MTRGKFVLENCEQFLTARHSILVTDCKSLYDAIHKAQLQRQQTRDWQLSLVIVKAKAVSGATDLRWMDARYQIEDCLTKHASRKSETVLQKIQAELLQKRICWTNENKSERFVTVLPMTKKCGLRTNDQMAKMGCKQEN